MKLLKKRFTIIILLLYTSYCYSQENNLDSVRRKYCGKNCNIYIKNEEKHLKSLNSVSPPPLPTISKKNKFSKLFYIPIKERSKLFPFITFDSIYVTIPKLINDFDAPRDYLDVKYHMFRQLLTKKQKESLSDILFNYYKLNNFSQVSSQFEIGCDCLEAKYPKIILLFYKNGKPINYLAVHIKGNTTSNFKSNKLKAFDLTDEKEELILKLFDDFIKKNGNKPCDTIPQTNEPVLVEKKQE